MKILLIDDDEILVAQLTKHLVSQNYLVESVATGTLGLEYVQATNYDLVLLDLRLPGQDGISLCRQLRQIGYTGAILLQTVEADSDYKVAGLDAGADDYIVKPFSLEELSARIRALLRRPQEMATPVLQWNKLQLNPSTCEVFYEDNLISLSPKEYNLLELFMRNPQRVFNSNMLLERVWRFDETPGEETVRTHIKRLRQKLKRAGAGAVIENIYGMGYRLKVPAATVTSSEGDELADSADAARQAAQSAIHQFQDILFARLAALDQAATASVLSEAVRLQGQQAAHKLAGALGMFGLSKGSEYSRQLELLLQNQVEEITSCQLVSLVKQIHQVLSEVLPETPPFDHDATVKVPDRATQISFTENQASQEMAQPFRVLVVTEALDWLQTLQHSATSSLRVVHLTGLSQLANSAPDVLLLDMATLKLEAPVLASLGQKLESLPNLPVMVLTNTDSFNERLQISRYFSCTFLPRTLAADQVLALILDTLQRRCLSTIKLLAVDDDPIVLERLEQHLPRWGIHVTALEDPRLAWETLLDLNPDVLLLDVEMPHLNGIQLCQIIRSETRWLGLPILFLTACHEADTIQQIYAAGGDDYIAKPFAEPELVTRVLNRLERNQPTRLPSLDELPSGLMTESQAILALERDLMLAQHYRQPYCLGIITWKVVAPDQSAASLAQSHQVLHRLVDTLKANLRRVDILTQFQPGMVTVGLYGLDQYLADKRFQDLLAPLSQQSWLRENTVVQFYHYLATAPEDGTTLFALRQTLNMQLRHL
jgi:DNA-binding response OmpR family regulator/HPt (histidine-containing phosphotransfer) domain-containing protein